MPELLPTWEKLTELADGDPTIARLLTLYRPPAFLPACSQAVSVGVGETPVLVRNYDYQPRSLRAGCPFHGMDRPARPGNE